MVLLFSIALHITTILDLLERRTFSFNQATVYHLPAVERYYVYTIQVRLLCQKQYCYQSEPEPFPQYINHCGLKEKTD